ncbi:dioxygenase [Methylomonas paludis]|uniref:Dioxygenase n=1 Tax=Methylomonas paludis TaxID=1173101 RepID=A0A975R8Z5_9GAMM|nr:class III extradiol ring-cleavage dioxygenase [Methylomonas paludis]QWF70547.1 dioxygenase [Methylomonas paludis]
MNQYLAPVLFIPHGGGPLPLLGDAGHVELVEFLRALPASLAKQPAAILVISAHWEATQATITHADKPALIYDYAGFPEASYQITYPAVGNPDLAKQVFRLLTEHDIPASLDNQRGFDHGLFVPLKLMYPQADIPCLQLSLVNHLDPELHLKIGQALAVLRKQNILILGSGFSFHNMRAFFSHSAADNAKNQAFEDWLIETCCADELTAAERKARLLNWPLAPFAGFCHPRAEHLLPLHVCLGAGGATPAELVFAGSILGKQASGFLWRS